MISGALLQFALWLGTPGAIEQSNAHAQARECPTETAWIEQNPVGEWVAVCGDGDGNPLGAPGILNAPISDAILDLCSDSPQFCE